ncbi:hypothetical protein [Pusillimonas sp. NJUB218]|uniref:hypothetical protein n=1 Tax=Pusillimonas sp. NJUB218 TaxID=2023230 RepID=UPI000F4B3550|nr:hypothetical protein [Pusillimonas sp. NJUB218]
MSQRKLSVTHKASSAKVERSYQSFVKQSVSELSGRPSPRALGIDGHFCSRKKSYATTLVDLYETCRLLAQQYFLNAINSAWTLKWK